MKVLSRGVVPWLAGVVCTLASWSCHADPMIEPALNESLVFVPSAPPDAPSLEATLFVPDGTGPFPLAVLNHGKLPGPSRKQPRWRPLDLVRGWLQRGYAVYLPMRAGYANSGGPDDDPNCPDIAANGRAGGAHVRRAVDTLAGRADIDLTRIVMLGHSAGALSTLGYLDQPHPGVRVAVNLAGGWRANLKWCAWQDALVSGMQAMAPAASKVPVMWLYAENDSYFDPALAERMFRAFKDSGGQGVMRRLAAVGDDGHTAVLEDLGLKLVWPKIDALLAAAKLPTAVVQPRFADVSEPLPADSGFARVSDIASVPGLNDRTRAVYAEFLRQAPPRAFAISPDGAVGWANQGYKPQRVALRWCQTHAAPGRPCRLYAVDDRVVWQAVPSDASAK
ncbi:MAG: dienelactone hydrolase [Methylibium sp.]|nr:dienelactone hydrolase [Methylibium sp.]